MVHIIKTQSKSWTTWPLKMGLRGCPESSVRKNHHSMLRRTQKSADLKDSICKMENLIRVLTEYKCLNKRRY